MRICAYNPNTIKCNNLLTQSVVIFSHFVLQDEKLWFPSSVKFRIKADKSVNPKAKDTPSNISEVINNETCFNNGYQVTLRNGNSISVGFRYYLKCLRARRAKTSVGTKTDRNTSLSQSNCDQCQFSVPVYFDTEHNLWFVKKNCNTCFQHNGHFHEKREHMKLGVTAVSEGECF